MQKQKGFSLIELLIVVAIILIIAAIAIPNLLRARIAANEASAVASLRTLNTAQISYLSTYPTVGFATSLGALGGTSCAPPGTVGACIIDTQLASGTKSGYSFTLSGTSGTPNSSYQIRADPQSPNQTGVRYFLHVRGRRNSIWQCIADLVHDHRDAVAVGFDFGKVPGEGTSQRKAEEKSSAFLIVGLFLVTS
jgi:prepilin-type N-terminal cleavage/methylation domain-containing protein